MCLTVTWGKGLILLFLLVFPWNIKSISSIQQHFIKDIRAKFGIPNLPQSPDIRQNSDKGISDFRISGQSLINLLYQ